MQLDSHLISFLFFFLLNVPFCTQLNEAAKQLIEKDKTSLSSAPGYEVPVSVDANTVLSVTQSPILNNTGVVNANQRHVDIKKNAKKRHSFTALSMTHKSSHAMNNRHSMEISGPVLISSSDPRAAARIGGMAQLSSSAPVQVTVYRTATRGQNYQLGAHSDGIWRKLVNTY